MKTVSGRPVYSVCLHSVCLKLIRINWASPVQHIWLCRDEFRSFLRCQFGLDERTLEKVYLTFYEKPGRNLTRIKIWRGSDVWCELDMVNGKKRRWALTRDTLDFTPKSLLDVDLYMKVEYEEK